MSKKTKKKAKKVAKKSVKKISQELVIRVAPQESTLTVSDLVEPMRDGKQMALAKTWVSSQQLIKIVQKTPSQHVYSRPGKGGQRFSYVTGNYVTKVLNFVFGWNWDFDVISHAVQGNQVWVQGKLTVKSPKGETISKTQFGRADIKFLKSTKDMLDFGNDLKGATTDALKKCASLLGIASDIYGKMEYKQEANVEIKETEINVGNVSGIFNNLKENAIDSENIEKAILCSKCDGVMTQPESDFSQRIYKKKLCRSCQSDLRGKK